MAKLIDKDALVAEIENRIKSITERAKNSRTPQFTLFGKINALESLSLYINTLEVREVDLEKEVELWYNEYAGNLRFDWNGFAKHFFELGLRVNNEKEK